MNIRPYRNDDCSKVVDLLNICFPNKHITRESFMWKHFDPNFHEQSYAVLAEDNGEIVSFVCFVPSDIVQGNTKSNFYSCAIQATHPQHRRKGLVGALTQMLEYALGTRAQYFGFSNDSGVMIDKYSKRISYQIIGQLKTAYIPVFFAPSKYTAVEVPSIPVEYERSIKSTLIQPYKNSSYLDWRYVRHPKQKYMYVQVGKSSRVVGYVVARLSGIKLEVYDILAQDDPVVFRDICVAMMQMALQKGKMIFSITYLPNTFWKSILSMPHISRFIEIFFTVKSTHVSHNADDWLIQGGDIL